MRFFLFFLTGCRPRSPVGGFDCDGGPVAGAPHSGRVLRLLRPPLWPKTAIFYVLILRARGWHGVDSCDRRSPLFSGLTALIRALCDVILLFDKVCFLPPCVVPHLGLSRYTSLVFLPIVSPACMTFSSSAVSSPPAASLRFPPPRDVSDTPGTFLCSTCALFLP